LWCQADDVTIFGGWGAYEQGWVAVSRRLDWAASRFGQRNVDIDNLAAGSNGDLAYSIDIERNVALVDGPERPETALRVTHICRRAGDGWWQIVHRHADRLSGNVPGTPSAPTCPL
jgi:ketosteroid isomerase-like protein